MAAITRDDIQELVELSAEPCVSIYMPTNRETDQQDANRICLKNLIDDVADELNESGQQRLAAVLLQPARQLIADGRFNVDQQSEGLALFLSPNGQRMLRVPLRLPEKAVVGSRFYLKPLMPLISSDGTFYVLALSLDQVRLLRATRDSVEEVNLGDTPQGIEEALRFDDPEKSLQWHPSSSPVAIRDDVHHGHGAVEQDRKADIKRYFDMVDDGVTIVLREETAPLVLASVEYLSGFYREANSYEHLVEEVVTGNPEMDSNDELRRKAWQIVEPLFSQTRDDDADRFRTLQDDEQASSELAAVVQSAYYGRVDTLFANCEKQIYGRFDPETGDVERLPADADDATELVDFAALHAFLNGGTVYAVEAQDVPAASPVAAIFRY